MNSSYARDPTERRSEACDCLEHGRAHYKRREWADAFDALAQADLSGALEAGDLEMLAMSAFLTNRDDNFLRALERCHHAYLERGEPARAVRALFWLGFRLYMRGEVGPANGWFARGHRLLEGQEDCVERGYLLVTPVDQWLDEGDWDGAFAAAAETAAIGKRFRDADLVACALHLQGRALMLKGEVEAGLTLLDEAMVAVVAGEVSPLMTGLIYCSVIIACQQVYALGRAQQWTSALTRWCEAQPQIVAFTGACLTHRAELLQLRGDWRGALEEAERAREPDGTPRGVAAATFYQTAEVHRLRGAFAAAEADYLHASRLGLEPQPGFALLRLAQGRRATAAAAIRRVIGASSDPLRRARLLPAQVEIALASGDIGEANDACRELERTAAKIGQGIPGAIAGQARGAVLLAAGDAAPAQVPLRSALDIWQAISAPYETARVRELIGLTCRALGDADGAELELDAARAAFDELGAGPDAARIETIAAGCHQNGSHGLTPRELQVLRLVSAGKTNGAVAAQLFLSERTVERHLSNIYTKLDLPTRTAATAWAYEHDLI